MSATLSTMLCITEKDLILTNEEIRALLSSEPVAMPSRILGLREKVNEMAITAEYDRNWMRDFQYEGFNAKLIFSLLMARAKSTQKLVNDMTKMAMLFALRGNNLDKMVISMNPAGKAEVAKLRSIYLLESKLKNHDKRTTITLSRANQTLPFFCVVVYCKMIDLMSARHSCLDDIHVALQVSVATVYYRETWYEHAYYLHLAYLVILGAAIGDNKDTFGYLLRFVHAAQVELSIDTDVAEKFFEEIMIGYAPINWQGIRNDFRRVLSEDRGHLKLKDMLEEVINCLNSVVAPIQWLNFTYKGLRDDLKSQDDCDPGDVEAFESTVEAENSQDTLADELRVSENK